MDYLLCGLILFAYCLGSISSAVLICKLLNKPDPRTNGSNNPGATNVLRIAGKPYAAMVLLFDVLKGSIPVFVAAHFHYDWLWQSGVGFFAVLGHMFPIFMQFKGGKGVATGLGVLLVVSPKLTGLLFALFAIVILLTRMVSLGSILSAIAAPICFYILNDNAINFWFIGLAITITAKHHGNISRIIKGEENKLKFSRS